MGAAVWGFVLHPPRPTCYSTRMSKNNLADIATALQWQRVEGKWIKEAYAGTYRGRRAFICVQPTGGNLGLHLLQGAVFIYLDTGLTELPPQFEQKLPERTKVMDGKRLFKGSLADLVMRSQWGEPWQTYYLVSSPAELTQASVQAQLEALY